MFDPFKDFDQRGYLRNRYGEKDPAVVRDVEHTLFRAGLDEALAYVAKQKTLTYNDFLAIHRILFAEFYPWAGQDRTQTAPDIAVSKQGVMFCHPRDSRRAVDLGLQIGQDKKALRQRPGEVMGLFAYGLRFSMAMAARCSFCIRSCAIGLGFALSGRKLPRLII